MVEISRSSSPVRYRQNSVKLSTPLGGLTPRQPLAVPISCLGSLSTTSIAPKTEDGGLVQNELDLAQMVDIVTAKADNLLKKTVNNQANEPPAPPKLHDLIDRLARLESLLDKVNVVGALQPASNYTPQLESRQASKGIVSPICLSGSGYTPGQRAEPPTRGMSRSSSKSSVVSPLAPPCRSCSRVDPALTLRVTDHALGIADASCNRGSSRMKSPSRNRLRHPSSAREAYKNYCEDYEELCRSLSPRVRQRCSIPGLAPMNSWSVRYASPLRARAKLYA